MTDQPFDLCLAMDNGTETRAYSVFTGSTPQPGTFAGDGPTRMSVIYLPPEKDAPPVFGRRAFTRGGAHPERIYSHAKRGMYCDDPSAPWNGGPPAYQLYALGLEDSFQEAKRVFPHIGQLLTSERQRICIAVTIPASWGAEQMSWVDRGVAEFTSIDRIDAFVPEPVGVVYHAGDHFRSRIKEDDKIAILDLGGGTFDISVLQFKEGLWHELVGNAGSPTLGGNNYTCAVAIHIAEQLGYRHAECFDRACGLNLNHESLSPRHRRAMYLIYNAAEEAKIALSAEEETTVAIEIRNRTREITISRSEFAELVRGENERAQTAIRNALEGASLSWPEIEHVMLAGGSAGLVGMRQLAAAATERPEQQVFVSGDTTHAIANGASQRAFFSDTTSMCVAGGLAVRLEEVDHASRPVIDPETGRPRDRLKWLVGTGESVPIGGRTLESAGQFVRASAPGPTQFEIAFYSAKPGVQRRAESAGPVSEGIRLQSDLYEANFSAAGDHDALLALHMEPSGRMHSTVSFPDHPHMEPISIALSGSAGQEPPQETRHAPSDVLILMDCSGSMAEDSKIEHAKDAIEHLVTGVTSCDVRLALVEFGATTRITAPLGTSAEEIVAAARRMQAGGGTPLEQALRLAHEHVAQRKGGGRETYVVVVCDGYPNCIQQALREAEKLKKKARLFSVAIGEQAGEAFLRQLASQPGDYQHGAADQLIEMFDRIMSLCLKQDAA